MAVMPDVSQAGSGRVKGQIEFIINRVVLADDDLGLCSYEDEKDAQGNFLNVSNKYYL